MPERVSKLAAWARDLAQELLADRGRAHTSAGAVESRPPTFTSSSLVPWLTREPLIAHAIGGAAEVKLLGDGE